MFLMSTLRSTTSLSALNCSLSDVTSRTILDVECNRWRPRRCKCCERRECAPVVFFLLFLAFLYLSTSHKSSNFNLERNNNLNTFHFACSDLEQAIGLPPACSSQRSQQIPFLVGVTSRLGGEELLIRTRPWIRARRNETSWRQRAQSWWFTW
jgi:hypothetical protein